MGFTREEADSERNYFNEQVREHVSPRPPCKVVFVRYEVRGKERFIIKITVDESPLKPVIVKFEGIPSINMRREGFTNGAAYEEIIQMSISSQNQSYDTLPSRQTYDRKNFTSLLRFHKERTEGKALIEKALASLGFFDRAGFLANGAVLFQDDPKGSKTAVLCCVFSGLTKGNERIVTTSRFNGNITDGIQFVCDFVRQRMNRSIVKLGESHIEVDAFPERALFEGVVNAYAHGDYLRDGTQIQVDMYSDRLEISSPGSLFPGEPLEKTYDLLGIISKRRNELICGVLVLCQAMEATGSGFDAIVEEYRGADDAHRPYVASASDHFTLVLPDLTYNDGVSDAMYPMLEFAPVPHGSKYDEKILAYCYNYARKVSEIAAHLNISDSTHLRKDILGNLAKNGYLRASKSGRAQFWQTMRAMVRLR